VLALLLRAGDITALFARSALPPAFQSFQRNYLAV
jgi:hypothetical protein